LGFGKDNGGAIPSNLLQISNSESNSRYLASCKACGIKQHPARFPRKLPEFFIKLLTDPGDLVVDFFSGSNTTGEACEELGRSWLSFDSEISYVASSAFRFLDKNMPLSELKIIHNDILQGKQIKLRKAKEKILI